MKTWNTNLLQKRNNNGQMGPATLSPMKIWNTNLLQTRDNNGQMGLATLSHMKIWNTNLLQTWNNNGQMGFATYLSQGNGQFNLVTNIYNNAGSGYMTLFPMDINGDGRQDVLQTWNNNGQMAFTSYLSHGNGQFDLVTNTYNAGSGYLTLFPMDINGDCKQDVLQTWNNHGHMAFTSYMSDSDGNFHLISSDYPNAGTGYMTLFPIDINGDGRQDVLQTWNNNGQMAFTSYLSQGNGQFNLVTNIYNNAGSGYMTLFPMDINGDGRQDVLQTWNNNDHMAFTSYLSQGNGQFNLVTSTYTAGSGYMTLFPMDINGDGKLDVLQTWNNNSQMGLASYLSQGNGQFNLVTNTYNQGSGYMTLSPMDINVDGKSDMLQTWNNAGKMAFVSYLSRGDGYFDTINTYYNNAGAGYMTIWPLTNDFPKKSTINNYVGAGSAAKISGGVSSSSGIGDFNGNGIDDMILGSGGANSGRGAAYIVYGSNSFPSTLNLANFNGNNGIIINGPVLSDPARSTTDFGTSVSGAGDFNGDGLQDIVIGAPNFRVSIDGYTACKGAAYIVFGSGSYPSVVNADSFNGSNGFAINAPTGGLIFAGTADYGLGSTVSGIRDINHDGFADIAMGAPLANSSSGKTYVLFGSGSPFPASINVSTLNGTNGFVINDTRGGSVSGLGDVNGDGIDDFIVYRSPSAYVLFGKPIWQSSIDLSSLNGSNGFLLAYPGNKAGGSYAVGKAGDINHDGIMDIAIVGAGLGSACVVYGRNTAFPAVINLPSDLNGNNGFVMSGAIADTSAESISGIGDINGDGISDLSVGYPYNKVYTIYGRSTPFPANISFPNLDGKSGFIIESSDYQPNRPIRFGWEVDGAGDLNHDGINDLLITDPGSWDPSSYIVFGI